MPESARLLVAIGGNGYPFAFPFTLLSVHYV